MRIPWRSPGGSLPPAARQGSIRSVLLAALNTSYYAPLLRGAQLGSREAIHEAGPPELALARLPRVEPGLVPTGSAALLNPAAPGCSGREMHWPLPAAARTAVLCRPVEAREGLRAFGGRPDARRLARWRPEALAGPVGALLRLAEAGEESLTLSHSVIAFATLRRAFLTEEARERFWSAWRVPAFGQIFGLSRELLAWECEAHQGYHFDSGRAIFEVYCGDGEPELLATSLVGLRRPAIRLATCLTGRIDQTVCGCGRRGPRLVDVRPRARAGRARAAAVGAGAGQAVLR